MEFILHVSARYAISGGGRKGVNFETSFLLFKPIIIFALHRCCRENGLTNAENIALMRVYFWNINVDGETHNLVGRNPKFSCGRAALNVTRARALSRALIVPLDFLLTEFETSNSARYVKSILFSDADIARRTSHWRRRSSKIVPHYRYVLFTRSHTQ